MIIVAHAHVFGDVVDGVMDECDPAFLHFVSELELIKDPELLGGFHLGPLPRRKRILAHVVCLDSGVEFRNR